VSDETLRERQKNIRQTYNALKQYRFAVRHSYDNNQKYYPEFIIELYGADQSSLQKVQGHFTQLEQLLITDYYYTQRALNPNQRAKNLAVVTTPRNPSFPEAKITDYDIPRTVTVGERATASVTVKTQNAQTPSQTITVGLPDDENVKSNSIEIVKNTIDNPSYQRVYSANAELFGGYGEEKRKVPYPVIETAGKMEGGSTHTLTLSFVPKTTGEIRLWFKSIAQGPAADWTRIRADHQTIIQTLLRISKESFQFKKQLRLSTPGISRFRV
jgi:hypothetical protein